MVEWCYERIVSVKTFLCAIMRFHFNSFSYMSTVHVDLNLRRFQCVFAYKVAPYFILYIKFPQSGFDWAKAVSIGVFLWTRKETGRDT